VPHPRVPQLGGVPLRLGKTCGSYRRRADVQPGGRISLPYDVGEGGPDVPERGLPGRERELLLVPERELRGRVDEREEREELRGHWGIAGPPVVGEPLLVA